MLITVDPNEVREYSFPEDTDPKTVFLLGTLDARLMEHINETTQETTVVNGKEHVKVQPSKRFMEYVRFGIKGWRNLANKAGKVEFDAPKHIQTINVPEVGERRGLSDDALDTLKPYFTRLGTAIWQLNMLPPEEAKN